jgi:hypothetical protein
MNSVFSLILLSAPLLSWGRDSLVLDTARLGITTDGALSSTAQWVYADIVVMERNTADRWSLGLRPIPVGQQQTIDDFAKDAEAEPEESGEYIAGTTYYIGSRDYAIGKFKGPWEKMEALIARLAPASAVSITDSPQENGASAVSGDLYCGENATFRSASGTYNLSAPPPSARVSEYLASEAEEKGVPVDELVLKGILYLEGSLPLFFYISEGY